MAKLGEIQSDQFVKMLYIGDSSTGKTGSLVSLVEDRYELGILDLDAGIDSLRAFIKKQCPEKINNVDVETRRDKYRGSPAGPMVSGTPKAFTQSLELMTKWSDGSDPGKWGPNKFFILDTLSSFSRAAFEWAKGMNPTSKDPRQWYAQGQNAVQDVLALLTGPDFQTNLIVISHVNYVEQADGTTKGYANSLGKALGPIIPRYFNTLVLAESVGAGKNTKRRIKTLPTGLVDLKTPVPFTLDAELPLETGLSTIVKALKGTHNA